MKCFIDGNVLCITYDDFVNMHESKAFFLPLSDKVIQEIRDFELSRPYRPGIYRVNRENKEEFVATTWEEMRKLGWVFVGMEDGKVEMMTSNGGISAFVEKPKRKGEKHVRNKNTCV